MLRWSALLCASLIVGSAAARPRLGPPGVSHGAGARYVSPSDGPEVPRHETRAVVLLYHAFDVGPDPLGVSSPRFAAHLDWLADNDVHVVPLSALIDFVEGKRRLPEKVAVITIDDAHKSVYTKAFPLLEHRRMPFTLGLPTAFVGQPRQPTLVWDEIREMVSSGLCELASHGHRHRRLGVIHSGDAEQELEESRTIIERETGVRPLAYFYPMGAHEGLAPQRVERAGYRAAFTSTGGALAFEAFARFTLPRTTVLHSHGVKRVGWLFSNEFLEKLPRRPTAALDPALTTSSNTR